MFRGILYLVIGLLILTFVRSVMGMITKAFGELFNASPGQPGSPPTGGELKKDPVCGTFISTATAFQKGVDLGHYELGAYVVMPNHVHLLIRPSIAPERLMKSLKGASAREANRVLGRTGEPFWQKESYDHWVRNPSEFQKTRMYIEANPVKAGLWRSPQDYPWSCACVETSLDAARTSACAALSERLWARGPAPPREPFLLCEVAQ